MKSEGRETNIVPGDVVRCIRNFWCDVSEVKGFDVFIELKERETMLVLSVEYDTKVTIDDTGTMISAVKDGKVIYVGFSCRHPISNYVERV